MVKRPTRILPTPAAIRPATDPANAGVRDAFCLNTFPPSNGHGSGPQPPVPAPATTPAPQAKAQATAA